MTPEMAFAQICFLNVVELQKKLRLRVSINISHVELRIKTLGRAAEQQRTRREDDVFLSLWQPPL